MSLTPLQRSLLDGYKHFRDKPLAMHRHLFRAAVNHVPSIIMIVTGIVFAATAEIYPIVWCLVGIAIGGIYNQCVGLLVTTNVWPLIESLLDWKKIDELLATDSETPPSSTHG